MPQDAAILLVKNSVKNKSTRNSIGARVDEFRKLTGVHLLRRIESKILVGDIEIWNR